MTIQLENWSAGSLDTNPYLPPELKNTQLHGEVYGHPRFRDGTEVTTSDIIKKQGKHVVTLSGSEYELGQPHPDYEKAFPEAIKSILES